ncbi:hypothetical protein V2J09_012748 [Rumex salicifolius]
MGGFGFKSDDRKYHICSQSNSFVLSQQGFRNAEILCSESDLTRLERIPSDYHTQIPTNCCKLPKRITRMAQIRKLEAEVEIASTGDLFYESFTNAPHHLLKLQPEVYQRCDLLEGEFGKPGFVVLWAYTLEGKSYVMKERFETIDRKNKILKQVVLEGDVMDSYKSFELTIRALTKGEGMHVIKWSIEYEKIHEGVPDPHNILEAVVQATKRIDNYISSR